MGRKFYQRFLYDQDRGGGSGGSDGGDDNPNDETPPELSENEKKLQAELEQKNKELEDLKKDRDGQSRRVTNLEKDIADIKKAQMTEEERKKAEEAEREAERQKKDQEAQGKILSESVKLAAERSGISEEDQFLLSSSNQDEVFKKGDRLKELLVAADQAGYERAMKDKTKTNTPGNGEEPGGNGNPKLGKTTLESLKNLS